MTRTEREDGHHGCKTQLSTNAKYGNTNKNVFQIGVTLSQTTGIFPIDNNGSRFLLMVFTRNQVSMNSSALAMWPGTNLTDIWAELPEIFRANSISLRVMILENRTYNNERAAVSENVLLVDYRIGCRLGREVELVAQTIKMPLFLNRKFKLAHNILHTGG